MMILIKFITAFKCLRQQSCKMMRRQGRSFQSSMLKIEQVMSMKFKNLFFCLCIFFLLCVSHICMYVRMIQVHSGSCKAPCEGMEDLGAFEAFNLRATNNGPVLFKIS